MVFVAATGTPLSRTSIIDSIAAPWTLYSSVAGFVNSGVTLKHSPKQSGISSFLFVEVPPSVVSEIGVLSRCNLSRTLILSVSLDLLSISSIVPLNIVSKSERSQRTSPTNTVIDLFTQISCSQLSSSPPTL